MSATVQPSTPIATVWRPEGLRRRQAACSLQVLREQHPGRLEAAIMFFKPAYADTMRSEFVRIVRFVIREPTRERCVANRRQALDGHAGLVRPLNDVKHPLVDSPPYSLHGIDSGDVRTHIPVGDGLGYCRLMLGPQPAHEG